MIKESIVAWTSIFTRVGIRMAKTPCLLPDLSDEFKILKRSTVGVTKTSFSPQMFSMNKRFARFSSMYQLKKAVAWITRLRGKLLKH